MDTSVTLSPQDVVLHPKLGRGTVELDKGITVIVRFDARIEECEKAILSPGRQVSHSIFDGDWAPAIEVVTRFQAEAIVSINDNWGLFSRSQIALLPHQLWVCHRVLRRWPARWLVADDVGLGKTIEAGLILWPLISKKLTQRVLILCPAKLVEQWQYRLRTMFDIRLRDYSPEADRPRSDFWNSSDHVVASLPTLRIDHKGRHERLLAAKPWDLLIVDEAHHLNANEHQGATLGYALIKKLMDRGMAESALFFTGTPHRGKPYNFWALLQLLRPDLFDPERPDAEQLPHLREVLIRNNKQSVTDMQGSKLFKPIQQHPATYEYNDAEREFYRLLTEFIASGRAYASTLSRSRGNQIMLVLIAMQKLASSSVAAIRRALKGRLQRLTNEKDRLQKQLAEEEAKADRTTTLVTPEDDADLLDLQQILDELAVERTASTITLLANEIPHLRTLVDAADAVTAETKIERIASLIAQDFPDRQILLFTEYKATQALVMSALIREYGDDCVALINGDGYVDGVVKAHGALDRVTMDRTTAADRFNAAQVRFLVSTEAGGEGIDLQDNCYTLIHVDLPWNPMRLHQRVGRLHRYGQREAVDVISLRNEETVEARIWDKLNHKIESIMQALGLAMDEPEDLLQLVLGMSDKSLFTELFSQASAVPKDRLADWFDEKTKTFGGTGVIETVKALVGNAAKFGYQGLQEIPALDLPDLRPFFELMLTLNGRRPQWQDEKLSFKTPETWLTGPAVLRHYRNAVFSRDQTSRDKPIQVIGIGHAAFDSAIEQAQTQGSALGGVVGLAQPIVIAKVFDRVTESAGAVRYRAFGVVVPGDGAATMIVSDDELLVMLNGLKSRGTEPCRPAVEHSEVERRFVHGVDALVKALPGLNLPFKVPDVRALGVLWPI